MIDSGQGISEGPILGEAPGTIIQQGPTIPPPTYPPSLGAPSGQPAVPAMPERFVPIPTPAPTAPANPSSRSRI